MPFLSFLQQSILHIPHFLFWKVEWITGVSLPLQSRNIAVPKDFRHGAVFGEHSVVDIVDSPSSLFRDLVGVWFIADVLHHSVSEPVLHVPVLLFHVHFSRQVHVWVQRIESTPFKLEGGFHFSQGFFEGTALNVVGLVSVELHDFGVTHGSVTVFQSEGDRFEHVELDFSFDYGSSVGGRLAHDILIKKNK